MTGEKILKAQCLISFGSNLGQRDALIAEAAQAVASSSLVHAFKASRLFETPPIGGPAGQEPFLNAVAALDTDASAGEILQLLQQTEQRLGRTRQLRWDSRCIDLDVILHGQLVGAGTGLIVPHPRYTARRFVLLPACDVASHYRDPRFGWTLRQLSDHLEQGVPSLALVGGDQSIRRELLVRLEGRPGIEIFYEQPSATATPLPGDFSSAGRFGSTTGRQQVPRSVTQPWVSAFLPKLPELTLDGGKCNSVPRLVARIQQTTLTTCWPAPHQIWPTAGQWPEYRLEVNDIQWAVGEIESALHSMQCPVHPITADGNWWQQ